MASAPGAPRGVQNLLDIEIALRRGRRAEQHGFARLRHMQRMPVRFGIDRDRRHAHAVESADDAARDGAPVGDQDF